MNKLLVIAGPTAVGKTNLSISIAKEFNGEIISCDSMQIYKGFDIGTAKVNKNEMQGVVHHMIDCVDAKSDYSVSEYASNAKKIIADLQNRKILPILVGGTGLYIDAVLYPFSFGKTYKNDELRSQLEKIAQEHGNEYLHKMLKEKDAIRASEIHPNNVKRVIRALEVVLQGGYQERKEKTSEYDYLYLCVNCNREELYKRINKRVDLMIEQGLENEVKKLLNSGISKGCQAMQSIGYKEWLPYLNGETDRQMVVNKIKQNSRNYAKRQLTWFKHREKVVWCDNNIDEAIFIVKNWLNN